MITKSYNTDLGMGRCAQSLSSDSGLHVLQHPPDELFHLRAMPGLHEFALGEFSVQILEHFLEVFSCLLGYGEAHGQVFLNAIAERSPHHGLHLPVVPLLIPDCMICALWIPP